MANGFSPIAAVMLDGLSRADIEKRLAILDSNIASMSKEYQIISQTIMVLENQLDEAEKDQDKQYYILEANIRLRLDMKAYLEGKS